jgi:hypothetical protein
VDIIVVVVARGLSTQADGSLRQQQVSDVLRCSGPLVRYTGRANELFIARPTPRPRVPLDRTMGAFLQRISACLEYFT